jgi:hypothetical protein
MGVFIQRVQNPYARGRARSISKWQGGFSLKLKRTLALSRGDPDTEGSQTAKSGTDEQEGYMRL